jgi:hypothetical protein
MTTTTAATSKPLTRNDVIHAARAIHANHAVVAYLNEVFLSVEATPTGPRYTMTREGVSGGHSIAAEPSITSLERLTAHLAGFVGVELRADDPAVVEPARAEPARVRMPARRGPGGIVFTPAKGDEPALITLPFGRGQASLESVLGGDLELTAAQQAWLTRIEEALTN